MASTGTEQKLHDAGQLLPWFKWEAAWAGGPIGKIADTEIMALGSEQTSVGLQELCWFHDERAMAKEKEEEGFY